MDEGRGNKTEAVKTATEASMWLNQNREIKKYEMIEARDKEENSIQSLGWKTGLVKN
jgi:hypothetical protein